MFEPPQNHVLAAFKLDAIGRYPQEACGILAGGQYLPIDNVHEDPEHHFAMPGSVWRFGPEAVFHSHTNRRKAPSRDDMEQQIRSALPWAIVTTDGKVVSDPVWFGDQVPIPPLIGRDFVHGVTDCFSLARDWYRMRGIVFPDVPRDDEWWNDGGNLYLDYMMQSGFRIFHVGPDYSGPLEIGDGLLMRISRQVKVPHHGAVYVGNGKMIHHLADTTHPRLSVEEPVHRWRKYVTHWIRRDA